MKARLRRHPIVLALLGLLLPAVAPIGAAAQARGSADAQRILVTVFQSADKELGAKVASQIRDRLGKEYSPKDVWVIPTIDINNTLSASGYPSNEALGPSDARQLAVQVRADQYVDGTATQTPTGVRIEARLVLARDARVAQALPVAEGSLDRATSQVVQSVKNARKQTGAEQNCYRAFREGKYETAVSAVRRLVDESPDATLAAICLGNAYGALKMQDSVQAIGERTVARDPRNIPALTWLAEIYRTKNDPRRITTLMALVAADPSDLRLQQAVVNELAASGQASLAVPFVTQLVQNNPGDPAVLHTGWLVLLAAKDYERALTVGSELIRIDTTAADTAYYLKTFAAYSAMNRPSDAAQVLTTGVQKFPSNVSLLLASAQQLLKAGQTAQAQALARRVLSIDPKHFGANVTLLQTLTNPDEISAAIQSAQTNGVDANVLSQFALQQANVALNQGQLARAQADSVASASAKNESLSRARAAFARALRFAQTSDRLAASVDAKYIAGIAAYFIGEGAFAEAVKTKNCVLARVAQENFAITQTTLPAAGRAHPEVAGQLLQAVQQYGPSVTQAVKQFCK